jgi:hypothetical protein
MCIIIDANVANEFASESLDAIPVLKRVVAKKLKIVCGGRLKAEWHRTKLRRMYQQLVLAGSLVEYTEEQTQLGIEQISTQNIKSDDPHVLGLARVSGARILFSKDVKLHDDFKNMEILPGKGKIYQNAAHVHVLNEGICHCH